MQNRLEGIFTLKINIKNEFDRGIIRRKINKLESMDNTIFIKINKAMQKEKQFIIEYDSLHVPLRSITKQKQAGLHRSKMSRLPYIFKQNSISTRISITNIFVNPSGDFVYFLNLKEFDISPKQQNTLLQRMYMMEWETIISIVGGHQQTETNQIKSPQSSYNVPISPKHNVKASLTKMISEPNKSPVTLTQSKKFFTASNKPEPRSKQDFNTLKSLQFQNIVNLNHEYIHQFMDILCDTKPSTNFTQTSSSRNTICKSTKSY